MEDRALCRRRHSVGILVLSELNDGVVLSSDDPAFVGHSQPARKGIEYSLFFVLVWVDLLHSGCLLSYLGLATAFGFCHQ